MTEPLTPQESRLGRRLTAHLDALDLLDPRSILDAVSTAPPYRLRRLPLGLLAAALIVLAGIGVAAGSGVRPPGLTDTVVLPPEPTLQPPPHASIAPSDLTRSPIPFPSTATPFANGDVLISLGGHLYLSDPSGRRAPAELAGPDGPDWDAAWSPDGTRILSLNGSVDGEPDLALHVLSPDGLTDRRLTGAAGVPLHHVQQPVWSPDGRRIAMRAELDGHPGVYVIEVETTAIVARIAVADLGAPAWSPDGTQLVVHDGEGALAVVTLSDESVRRIVAEATVSDPVWGVDGWIYFTEFVGAGTNEFHGAVFRVRPDGSQLIQVTDPGRGRLDVFPALAPDARTLAVTRQDQFGASSPAVCCGTVVRSLETGDERLATVGSGAIWSPDGRWLVVDGVAPGDTTSTKVAWIAVPIGPGDQQVLLVRNMFSGASVGRSLSWGRRPGS